MLGFQSQHLLALLADVDALGLAGVLIASGLRRPLLQPPLNALRLTFHLLQCRALVGGVALGQPALLAQRLQLRGLLRDGRNQRRGFGLRLRQLDLQFAQTVLGFAQLALQRQRAFAGRFAAGHRGVVEALALRCQKKCVRVAPGQA